MQNQKALKINDDFSAKKPLLIQAMNSERKNRLKIKKFVFLTKQSVKKVSEGEYTTWKPPRLCNEGKRKFIELKFRVPDGLPEELQTNYGPAGSWHRFRIFQNVNHRHSSPELVQRLLDKLVMNLENGYSPFDEEAAEFRRIMANVAEEEKAKKKLVTVSSAVERFLAQYNEENRKAYAVPLNLLRKYLCDEYSLNENPWYESIEELTQEDLEEFLIYGQGEKKWSPGTYNDKVKKLVTFFNFCKRQKIVGDSPAAAIEKLKKGITIKHQPFDDDLIPDVKKAILGIGYWGQYLHNFCEVTYYACTRTDKELRRLQVKHILWSRHQIEITPEIGKKGIGRHIYMVPELEALFEKMNLKSFPKDFYIFGKDGPPGPIPTEKAFFSNKFRIEIRDPKGWDSRLTIYSFKHTRVLHLYLGGALISAIQQLCGHSKPSQTEEYLSKGLGLMLGNVTHNVSKSF